MKKQAHGATCRSCRTAGDSLGKHSADRHDAGDGGYEALFREELASLSLKRNTVKSVFPSREDDSPSSEGDVPTSAILFFANLFIFAVVSSPRYSLPCPSRPFILSPSYIFIRSPTFPMFSRSLFQMRFARQQINFLHLNCREREGRINFRTLFYKVFTLHYLGAIIIISCFKITFVRHY